MQNENDNRLDNLIALPYAKNIQWIAVGHTYMHIRNKSDRQIFGMLHGAKRTGKFFARKFLQFFNGRKSLSHTNHPNNPLIISHLHKGNGNDGSRTIHYHFAFGNIPPCITKQDMMTIFYELWVNKAMQSENSNWLEQARSDNTGWLTYAHNENKLGSLLGLDINSTHIPNTNWQN